MSRPRRYTVENKLIERINTFYTRPSPRGDFSAFRGTGLQLFTAVRYTHLVGSGATCRIPPIGDFSTRGWLEKTHALPFTRGNVSIETDARLKPLNRPSADGGPWLRNADD